jgi:hypothetical protein
MPNILGLESVYDLKRKVDGLTINVVSIEEGDLVTVIEDGALTTFLQFNEPTLMVENVPSGEHSFNLTYTNGPHESYNYL